MQLVIWTIIELEEDIMVLNNVTKFHKIQIKTIRLRERTSFQIVNFHKQRAITTDHSFCLSVEYSMIVKLLNEQHFWSF